MHMKMHTVIKKAFSFNEFSRFQKGFDSPQLHHNVETKKMSLAKSPIISGFFATQTAIFLCTETQM